MSLTLRDAQHASWKIFKKIKALSEVKTQTIPDLPALVTDLLRKADEVAATIRSLESLEQEETESKTLEKKLDDLLYCIFVMAERYGLNLEESFLEHLDDILLRLLV